MYMTTHLRLCRGNLVDSTEYAALLTDSLTSSVDSITLSNVAFDGGRDNTIVFLTSLKNETTPQSDATRTNPILITGKLLRMN